VLEARKEERRRCKVIVISLRQAASVSVGGPVNNRVGVGSCSGHSGSDRLGVRALSCQ